MSIKQRQSEKRKLLDSVLLHSISVQEKTFKTIINEWEETTRQVAPRGRLVISLNRLVKDGKLARVICGDNLYPSYKYAITRKGRNELRQV